MQRLKRWLKSHSASTFLQLYDGLKHRIGLLSCILSPTLKKKNSIVYLAINFVHLLIHIGGDTMQEGSKIFSNYFHYSKQTLNIITFTSVTI